MAFIDPLTPAEILAINLALDAERAGVSISAVAKPGCSAGLIAMAEQMRIMVAEMRAALHADGAERGFQKMRLMPHSAIFSPVCWSEAVACIDALRQMP